MLVGEQKLNFERLVSELSERRMECLPFAEIQ